MRQLWRLPALARCMRCGARDRQARRATTRGYVLSYMPRCAAPPQRAVPPAPPLQHRSRSFEPPLCGHAPIALRRLYAPRAAAASPAAS